jgi:hypothetical protein
VADQLQSLIEASPSRIDDAVDPKMIQVLRDPRSVTQHFERLELNAQRRMEFFVKPPYFNRVGNKAEEKMLRRGVQVRAIYEKAGMEDPAVAPYFHQWVADGEEARIYAGTLPHKMVIFDSQIVLLPLFTPGEEMRALLVRNEQLAQTLTLGFEHIWQQSEPFTPRENKPTRTAAATSAPNRLTSTNGSNRRRKERPKP